MSLDALSMLAALSVGIALATERLIETLKTVVWGLEGSTPSGSPPAIVPLLGWEVKVNARIRRIVLQLVAFVFSWTAAAYIAGGDTLEWFGSIPLLGDDGTEMPAVVLGLLGSGGSAFWKDIVTWTNSTKAVKKAAADKVKE